MANFDVWAERANAMKQGMTFLGAKASEVDKALGRKTKGKDTLKSAKKTTKAYDRYMRRSEKAVDSMLDDRTFGEKFVGFIKKLNPVRLFQKIFKREKEDDFENEIEGI